VHIIGLLYTGTVDDNLLPAAADVGPIIITSRQLLAVH